jgi:endonuclease YncB( thermonuclease family)
MTRRKRSLTGCFPFVLLFAAIGMCNQPRPDSTPSAKPERKERVQVSQPDKNRRVEVVRQDSTPDLSDNKNPKKLHLRVVGVHDGDTITGLDGSKTQFKIRLDAIDAPELGQPFGQASKKALSEKVFGKDVVVIAKTTDRYGRTVGHILIDGRDVNLEMLEEGMAWHYKKYDKNKRLGEAEESARAAKKGLWQDRDPVPPWDWRKDRKEQRQRKSDAPIK